MQGGTHHSPKRGCSELGSPQPPGLLCSSPVASKLQRQGEEGACKWGWLPAPPFLPLLSYVLCSPLTSPLDPPGWVMKVLPALPYLSLTRGSNNPAPSLTPASRPLSPGYIIPLLSLPPPTYPCPPSQPQSLCSHQNPVGRELASLHPWLTKSWYPTWKNAPRRHPHTLIIQWSCKEIHWPPTLPA